MVDIRVGIIGFGGAGMAHKYYFSLAPGCRVTRVFDPKPAGQKRAAETAPELCLFDTIEKFFDDVDAVSVCTPDDTHADYICAALKRGVHVLSEKPLTNSIGGIRRI